VFAALVFLRASETVKQGIQYHLLYQTTKKKGMSNPILQKFITFSELLPLLNNKKSRISKN
jgi:hypothetical protein